MRYQGYFMFENHTFEKVEGESVGDFMGVVKDQFEKDKKGLVGHVKVADDEILNESRKDCFGLKSVSFELNELCLLETVLLSYASCLI